MAPQNGDLAFLCRELFNSSASNRIGAIDRVGDELPPSRRSAVLSPAFHLVHDHDPDVRAAIARAPRKLSAAERAPYVPVVAELARDDSCKVRGNAVGTIAILLPDERAAHLDAIEAAFSDPEGTVRAAAAAAIARLTPAEREPLLGSWSALLRDTYTDVTVAAITTLPALTPAERAPHLAALDAIMADGSRDEQAAAAKVMATLSPPERQPRLRVFGAMLSAAQGTSGEEAITTFQRLSEAEREGMWPAVISRLDGDKASRAAAYDAVKAIPLGRLKFAEAAAKLLEDGSSSGRVEALLKLPILPQAQRAPLLATAGAHLSDQHNGTRAAAAVAFGSFTPEERGPYLEALMDLFSDSSWEVRCAAAATFGALTPVERATRVFRFVELLDDRDTNVRAATAKAFGALTAEERVPHLDAFFKMLAHDNHDTFHAGAVSAILSFEPAERAVRKEEIVEALAKGGRKGGVTFAAGYASLSEEERSMFTEAFHKLLRDSDEQARRAAYSTLTSMDESARAIHLSALVDMIADERLYHDAVVTDAAATLTDLPRHERAPFLERLCRLIAQDDTNVKVRTFKLLSTLPEWSDIQRSMRQDLGLGPHLASLFTNTTTAVRLAAAEGFDTMLEGSRSVNLDKFAELLQDERESVRAAAVRGFAKLTWTERAGVLQRSKFFDACRDKSDVVRLAAAESFARLGHEERTPHISAFAKLLADEDVDVRCAAALGIVALDPPERRSCLPAVVSLLRDTARGRHYGRVCECAFSTLERLPATERMPHLEEDVVKMLRHKDNDLQRLAARLLMSLAPDERVLHLDALFGTLTLADAHNTYTRAPIIRYARFLSQGERAPHLHHIVAALSSTTSAIRDAARYTFLSIPPTEREPHLSRFFELLSSEERSVRQNVASACAQLRASERARFLDDFAHSFTDESDSVRFAAVRTYKSLTDPERLKLLPQFVGLLTFDDGRREARSRLAAAAYFLNLPEFVRAPHSEAFGQHIKLDCHDVADIHVDRRLVKSLLHVTDHDLREFSKEYYPVKLTSESFVQMGERWALPQLKRLLGSGSTMVEAYSRKAMMRHDQPREVEFLTPDERGQLRALVKRFIEVQVQICSGREQELAAIVEETEAVHREPFRVALTEIYKEGGCSGFLDRAQRLASRVSARHDKVVQTSNNLDQVLADARAVRDRFSKFICKLAELSNGKHVPAALKSELRVLEKLQLHPDPKMRDDVSAACDIVRGGLVYQTTSQMSYALQLLQACDINESSHTSVTQEVFGSEVEEIAIV